MLKTTSEEHPYHRLSTGTYAGVFKIAKGQLLFPKTGMWQINKLFAAAVHIYHR
jgi:hypothetical protein